MLVGQDEFASAVAGQVRAHGTLPSKQGQLTSAAVSSFTSNRGRPRARFFSSSWAIPSADGWTLARFLGPSSAGREGAFDFLATGDRGPGKGMPDVYVSALRMAKSPCGYRMATTSAARCVDIQDELRTDNNRGVRHVPHTEDSG